MYINVRLFFLLLCCCGRIVAQVQPLIAPIEPPAREAGNHEQGNKRTEDFLQDCFLHPSLKKKVELNLARASLREVVSQLAKLAGFSVVVDDAVAGTVPLLVVRGEPIGSVLHALLATHSPPLSMLIIDNVMQIGARSLLIKRARCYLASIDRAAIAESIPLVWAPWTEQLKLKLEAMWQHCVRQHVGPTRSQYFFIDDEGKRVLVQGTEDQVSLFCRMIRSIDVASPQVSIEARVVLAKTDFITKLGLNTQLFYGGGDLSLASVGGVAPTGLPLAIKTITGGGGLELPLVFKGKTAIANTLALILNAAENRNLVHTLLAPRIMSCSGKAAVLHDGLSIPIESYTEDAVEGRTRTMRSAQYRDIGVKVHLKPLVLPDNKRIRLDVVVENSHLSPTTVSSSYPVINTARLQNTVILEDKQTVLLGGLAQAGKVEEVAGVPWLSRVPFLNLFFSGKSRTKQTRRLYVFLSVRLLHFQH